MERMERGAAGPVYCVYTVYGFTLYTPAAPRAPARDCGKPRSSLERPDPENSSPHSCTEIEYGMPLPQEEHMHMHMCMHMCIHVNM